MVYDTPTPPSQSYSVAPLQTSIRPRGSSLTNNNIMSTALPKSRLNQQIGPFNDDSHSASTFTTTDFGGYAKRNELESPGYGDGAMMGMGGKDRYTDMENENHPPSRRRSHHSRKRQTSNGRTQRRTRVDELSDVTLSDLDGSSARSSSTTTDNDEDDDEFSVRLGLDHHPLKNITSTPFQPNTHSNVNNITAGAAGQSAFGGMARELRKEFERIMDSGKAARTAAAIVDENHPLPISYMQPAPVANGHQRHGSVASPATALPRGGMPKRSPAKPSSSRPAQSNTTPVRSFGQDISARHRQQNAAANNAAPRNPFAAASSPRQDFPSQQFDRSASPFLVLSAKSGIAPPNNSRATKASASASAVQNGGLPSFTSVQNAQSRMSYNANDGYYSAQSPNHIEASPARSTASSSYPALRVPDVTGLTEGLTSPSRIVSSHRTIPSNANSSPRSRTRSQNRAPTEDPVLSTALADLRDRLASLESENARSGQKVVELEQKLADGVSTAPAQTRHHDEVVTTLKAEIDRLHHSIEQHSTNLAHLQAQHASKTDAQQRGYEHDAPLQTRARTVSAQLREEQQWAGEFDSLRDALATLSTQVGEVRHVLEDVLSSVKQIPQSHPRDQDLLRPRSRASMVERPASPATPTQSSSKRREQMLRSPVGHVSRHHSEPPYSHAPAYKGPSHAMTEYQRQQQQEDLGRGQPRQNLGRPSSAPPVNVTLHQVRRNLSAPVTYGDGVDGPQRASKLGRARNQEPLLDRAERILNTLPPTIDSHQEAECEVCRERAQIAASMHARHSAHPTQDEVNNHYQARQSVVGDQYNAETHRRIPFEQERRELARQREQERLELPMQTVISRALRDLEDDFAVHKKMYIELSDEYKLMDPATPDVGKRRILASHLKESIDVLEQKADEIKRLYDLLHYRGELRQSQEMAKLAQLAEGLRVQQRY